MPCLSTKIQSNGSQNVGVFRSVNEKTLHAVCHMLQRAADKAGWDLELRVGDAGSVLTGDERVLN